MCVLLRQTILFAAAFVLRANDMNFGGAMIGISTLSADGRSVLDATGTAVSLYKPENGLTFLVFAGRHLNDFLSVQGSYGWNRNGLKLTAVQAANAAERSYTARQHTLAGELMLYFRPRASAFRPYLSAGPGVSRFSAGDVREVFASPSPPPLPLRGFSRNDLCFRVAVGIDIRIRGGAAFRYSFAETIQKNPVSAQLTPPGQRNLANFQNLFGVVWRF